MSSKQVWDFWAPRYHKLWVQKTSLGPTRKAIIDKFKIHSSAKLEGKTCLDMGCGVGELIEGLHQVDKTLAFTGVDYSPGMVEIAKKRSIPAQWHCEDVHTYQPGQQFDFLVNTHSFPYYADQAGVIERFQGMTVAGGRIYMAFASVNSLYDKVCMALVKLTTGTAKYPSVNQFTDMVDGKLRVLSTTLIKEKWYMPSIVLFELEPIHE